MVESMVNHACFGVFGQNEARTAGVESRRIELGESSVRGD